MPTTRTDVTDTRSCPLGHTWTTSPADNAGCPHCARKRPTVPLVSSHPALAERWSTINGFPVAWVGAGTNRRAWFRCPKGLGHEFVAVVSQAAKAGDTFCPVCSGRQIRAGFNSLSDLDPEIAAQWHPDNTLRADEVALKSHVAARWRCQVCAHTWAQQVSKRVSLRGCPVCTGRGLVPGKTDFATKYPHEAREWDDANDLGPDEVTAGSGYLATWRCVDVHPDTTWQATVNNRSHGTGCPVCAGQRVVPGVNDLATLRPDRAALWDDPDRSPESVTVSSTYLARWRCAGEGHRWRAAVYSLTSSTAGAGCPECFSRVSVGETELAEFLRSVLGAEVEVITSDRTIIGPKELDIVIPSVKIAVEYNGVYWHSEKFSPRREHRDKYLACRAAGYRLIQVWEDDWRDRREIVQTMLARQVGRDRRRAVGARITEVVAVPRADAVDFFGNYHLQGPPGAGCSFLGLRSREGELVAVLAVRAHQDTRRIDRYATSVPVPGGFTKLLAHVESELAAAGGGTLTTFSAREVSDGALYAASGFTADQVLAPDYSYVVQARRVHKSNYRIERFRTDPELEYRDGLSETELAALNKLARVWDSGKVRWIKPVPPRVE